MGKAAKKSYPRRSTSKFKKDSSAIPPKKDDEMKKVYRQFSRQKFLKYKRQYPRMRESEVVAKIIKEWQAMDQQKKEQFKGEVMRTMGQNFFKSGSSSLSKSKSKNRSKSKSTPDSKEKNKPQALSSREASRVVSKKKKKESPKVRVFQEKKKPSPKRDTSDFKRSSSKSGKPYDSSEDPSDIMAKMKGINKGKKNISFENARNSQYLQFYKYYHERLSAEHPRWTSTQITTIIKLLWKKRAKQARKGELRRRIGKKGGEKVISGWQYYRKIKESEGHTLLTIKTMWRALPIQSKRFYRIQGQGKKLKLKRTSGVFVRKVLNSGLARIDEETRSGGIPQRDYSWMENQMN